jgi:hypothetical protein
LLSQVVAVAVETPKPAAEVVVQPARTELHLLGLPSQAAAELLLLEVRH